MSAPAPSHRWLIVLAPVLFLLLWSAGFTVAKIGLHESEVFTLLSLRYAGVLLLLVPLLFVFRPHWPASRAQWLHVIVVGFLIQVAYFGTCWIAFERGGSAGTLALITSMQPILVALLVPGLAGEPVSGLRWFGLLLGLVGTVLVIVGNNGVQPVSLDVLMFGVMGLLSITAATVYEKRFGLAQHPLVQNVIQYSVGLICTVPLMLLLEQGNIHITAPFLFALGYLIIGNSIIAISLLLFMIRQGEATRVSALFFLVPPLSAVIAWWVLGERMTSLAWFGLIVAALGVWVVTRSSVKDGLK